MDRLGFEKIHEQVWFAKENCRSPMEFQMLGNGWSRLLSS
jgi:hypothetical protein